jgi:phosphoglycerol transferase
MNSQTSVIKRDVSLATFVAWVLIFLAAALLVAKNLVIDNSVVFHDEYLYRAWSDLSFSRQHLLDANIVPSIPNRLFTAVYSVTTYAGLNGYDIAQLLNVAFWAIGTFATLLIARSQRVSETRLIALSIALVALPLSSYTKYFMPEAMYAGFYLASVLIFMKALSERRASLMVGAGFLVGLLYYVKPHGLIVLGINAAYLLFTDRRWKNLGATLLGLGLAVLAVRKLTPKLPHPPGDSLGIYTNMLRAQLDHFLNYRGAMLEFFTNLAYVGGGHLMMFFALCGMPFVAALGVAVPRFGLWVTGSPAQPLLSRYLLLSTAVLMAVAVVFTVLTAEVGFIHSRYYLFLWPLWACFAATLSDGRFTKLGAAVASVVTVLAVGSAVTLGPVYSPWAHISFISGSPEWGILFAPTSVMVLAFAVLAICSLIYAWTSRGVSAWLGAFALVGLVATVMAAIGQKTIFRNSFTDGRDAVAVQEVFGRDALNRMLVIGRDAGEVDKFLFFLEATPSVAWLPDGGDVNAAIVAAPPVERVILLSPAYTPPRGFTCLRLAAVRTCTPSDQAPAR